MKTLEGSNRNAVSSVHNSYQHLPTSCGQGVSKLIKHLQKERN